MIPLHCAEYYTFSMLQVSGGELEWNALSQLQWKASAQWPLRMVLKHLWTRSSTRGPFRRTKCVVLISVWKQTLSVLAMAWKLFSSAECDSFCLSVFLRQWYLHWSPLFHFQVFMHFDKRDLTGICNNFTRLLIWMIVWKRMVVSNTEAPPLNITMTDTKVDRTNSYKLAFS